MRPSICSASQDSFPTNLNPNLPTLALYLILRNVISVHRSLQNTEKRERSKLSLYKCLSPLTLHPAPGAELRGAEPETHQQPTRPRSGAVVSQGDGLCHCRLPAPPPRPGCAPPAGEDGGEPQENASRKATAGDQVGLPCPLTLGWLECGQKKSHKPSRLLSVC